MPMMTYSAVQVSMHTLLLDEDSAHLVAVIAEQMMVKCVTLRRSV